MDKNSPSPKKNPGTSKRVLPNEANPISPKQPAAPSISLEASWQDGIGRHPNHQTFICSHPHGAVAVSPTNICLHSNLPGNTNLDHVYNTTF